MNGSKVVLGGSVGRVVTSDTRGQQFESHQQAKELFSTNCNLVKAKIKEKRAGNVPIFKKNSVANRL